MDNITKKQEQKHINEVLEKLKSAHLFLSNTMKQMGKGNLDRLVELRENPETGMDFLLFLEQLHEKNTAFNFKDKYKRLEELEYSMKEPYFSRIDLTDHDSKTRRSYYIGKFGYTEGSTVEPIITDWRTKVASVYYRYRYPQKNVVYEAEGTKVVSDLELKRTFEIDKGELIKLYNNDIQFDESEIISDKIKKRTGGVLEDIIETIQEAQLDIIESDPRQVCIVQGCVGSGKSTVAIHKLSHIFFNYSSYIRPERSILVAKNQILVGYLSTLFPKLGIFDINYKTLRDLVVNLIFREEIGIDFNLDENDDTSKVNLTYISKVNKEIEKIHSETEDKLENTFEDDEFVTFSSYKYSKNMTPFENITEVIVDMEEELAMQKDKLKEDPKSVKAWIYKENIRILRRLLSKLNSLRHEIRETKLKKLARDHKINTNRKLDYTQTLIYLYMYAELVGVSKFLKYEYCVVDEGQDFSLIEYALLSKLILRGRLAIFGDLNQSIEFDGIADWDNIKQVITEAKTASIFKLETNYRSTKEIIELANLILSPYTKHYLPKSINRIGKKPELMSIGDPEDILNYVTKSVAKSAKETDKSIGIICFQNDIFERLSDKLVKSKEVKNKLIILDGSLKTNYVPKGIYLMKSSDCKGLEFAKVYVVGLDIKSISNYNDAKRAFVAVTRAMNDLIVISNTND